MDGRPGAGMVLSAVAASQALAAEPDLFRLHVELLAGAVLGLTAQGVGAVAERGGILRYVNLAPLSEGIWVNTGRRFTGAVKGGSWDFLAVHHLRLKDRPGALFLLRSSSAISFA